MSGMSTESMPRGRGCVMARAAMALALCACALALTGCVDQHPERAAQEAGTYEPRIVVTSPAIADICDRLDLDLAGVPATASALPDRYAEVAQVGAPMSPDLETVKSLRPDYIVSPNSLVNDLQPKYASIGEASLFLDLRSVTGLYESVQVMGDKFNRTGEAQALVDEFESCMEQYRANIPAGEAPRVLLLMGVPGSYVVATDKSYAGSLVALAGGENVYADRDEDFVNVSTEDMLSRDPDIILRTAHALPDQVMAAFAEEFETNDIWKHFRAVKEGKVFDLPSDQFGMSAQFNYADALEVLAPLLYSEGTEGQ